MRKLTLVWVCVLVLTLGLFAGTKENNGDIVEDLKLLLAADPGLNGALYNGLACQDQL